MKSSIYWHIAPCNQLKIIRLLGGTFLLHLHGWRLTAARNQYEAVGKWTLGTKYKSGSEADHPPPSSAEVKKGGAISPLPYISSWYSVYLIKHGDNFTLPYLNSS
jgi:hypothetical protein